MYLDVYSWSPVDAGSWYLLFMGRLRAGVCLLLCVCVWSIDVCMSVCLSVRFPFLKSAYFSINFGFGLFQ